jgi:predicted aconitase
MVTTYGVVIAHVSGATPERVIVDTACPSMIEAQRHADVWTRRHGHRAHDTDALGFYAYADRITGARAVGQGYRVATTRY